jgi:hypothetical protein
LREYSIDFSAQLFSSLKRWGIDEAHARLDQWFGFEQQAKGTA